MLLPAILGGIAGAVISTVIAWLVGTARQGVPRWFGWLRISYVRTAAATVGGIAAATGISLSVSDHSHNEITYIAWYGIAAFGFAVVIALTIVIDHRLMKEPDRETTSGDIGTTSTQNSPLEAWLEHRIQAHDVIVRERAVRSERESQEQLGAWDTQTANELSGLDLPTLRIDSSAAVAPHLLDSYFADPRNPGSRDGIAPPHTPDIWDAYYERRLDWLKVTLRRLRDGNGPPPHTPTSTEQKPREPVSPEHRDMLKVMSVEVV